MTQHVLDVTGMTCAACVRRVDGALRKVEGVAAVDVNFATMQARVEVDPAKVDAARLTAAIVDAGYGVLEPKPPDAATGRTAAEDEERRLLVRDLGIAAAATVPVLVLAMSHGALPGADGPVGAWIQAALGSIVLLGPGRRFLDNGWSAARAGSADMNTLVGLGALAAWGYSVAALLCASAAADHPPHVYFEAAASIVTFVLFGRFLETRARWQLGDAVRGLHALAPARAHRRTAVGEETVPAASLRLGDEVLVRPGERVPGDGVVVDGASELDQSLLTGESVPVGKGVGDRVVGGALNTTGVLVVRIDRTGAATALARIAAAVQEAQGSRAPIAALADRLSAVFVPIVLGIALATFAVWWLAIGAGFAPALERAVAVLVIACPCALGLATPAAVAVGVGRGAQLGVLFRGGGPLQAASHIDTVFVDKTGTLTAGRPELAAVVPSPGVAVDELLAVAAAVECPSEHPVAHAIVAAARARGIPFSLAEQFRAVPAAGVVGLVEGRVVRAGKAAWMAGFALETGILGPAAEVMGARGETPVFVSSGERLLGVLGVADRALPEAATAIAALRAFGVEVAMLTGDREAVANAVAAPLGITEVHAELLPTDKARIVAAARAGGRRVVMVGDGVNDAPALAAADVGMAVGTGTDVAVAAADVALLHGGIAAVPLALSLASATMATIHRNLLFASIYNLFGIPIAAGVLQPWTGWSLTPMFASAAMSLSSVSVLTSSLWLRRFGRATPPGGLR